MDVVIIGAGGLGREVLNYALDAIDDGWNANIIGWVDDSPSKQGQAVHDLPVLGNLCWLSGRKVAAIMGIGSPRVKAAVDARLPGQIWAGLQHPTAYVGRRNRVGEGVVLGPHVKVTTDVTVERLALCNLGVTIGHDAVIGAFGTLAPGVHISGSVQLGQGVDVGAGAAINPGCHVGSNTIIGAGAVVNRNLPPDVTAVGVPARPLVRAARSEL